MFFNKDSSSNGVVSDENSNQFDDSEQPTTVEPVDVKQNNQIVELSDVSSDESNKSSSDDESEEDSVQPRKFKPTKLVKKPVAKTKSNKTSIVLSDSEDELEV